MKNSVRKAIIPLSVSFCVKIQTRTLPVIPFFMTMPTCLLRNI